MTVLLTTGIYHVVENDGPMPYWVECRTFRRVPVVKGSEVRVKGFELLTKATAFMRRLTKEAVTADHSLKQWLTDRNGAPPPEASSTDEPKRRGRPPGAKNKVKPKTKPGPVARKKDPVIPFVMDRFTVVPQAVNATAQVYVCNRNPSTMAEAAIPHRHGDHAVALMRNGSLVFAYDEDYHPIVYPSFEHAERDAAVYHEHSEIVGKYPATQPVLYASGHIEVRAKGVRHNLFHLFDTKLAEWLLREGNTGGGYMNFPRLDSACRAADERRKLDEETPASVRLVNSWYETPGEKFEREQREDRLLAEQARKDEARQRQYEEDQAELERLATTRDKPIVLKGDAARAAAAAHKAKRVQIKNPTREQRYAGQRGMRRRALKDQRRQEGDE